MILHWKVHVASVYFRYFRGVLQAFHIDVAKVDRDVAYVAMAIYVCFSVGSKCFICSRRMLQVFHLDVAKVDLVLHMLQWDPPAAAVEAPPWVTVQGPEANRCIHGTYPEAGQVTGTQRCDM